MIGELEETYKDCSIKIHDQPVLGDNARVFFRIWKNNKPIFSLLEQISGTEMREMTREEAFDFLKKKGLERIKGMIDKGSLEVNGQYSFWEPKT
jgi:hypothetical protein